MYVEIIPGEIHPRPVGQLVTLLELPNGYDMFDGTQHYRGESVNEMFLDSMSLMDKWQNVFVISYDAWHRYERIMGVILKSGALNHNKPKVEPNYFELKAYTREKKESRKSITVLSTSNYLGAKEDEFGFSEEDEFLSDTSRETTEKMYSFFQRKMEEFGECFDYSTAKIGWNVWIKKYLPERIKMPKVINKEIQNHIRGARIQAYELGSSRYGELIDFNSLYGYIAENRFVSVEPVVHPLVSGVFRIKVSSKDGTTIERPVMPFPLFPKDVETMVNLVEQGQQQRKEVEGNPRDAFKSLNWQQYEVAKRLIKSEEDGGKGYSIKKAVEMALSPNSQINYHFFISWEYPKKPSKISIESHGAEGLTEYYSGQGRVTGIELKRMYEEGAKIQIHSYSAYRSEKIFGTFASDFNSKRLESKDKLNKAFYKLLIVGLVGRMGMKLPQRRSITSGELNTNELGTVDVWDLLNAEPNSQNRIPLSFTLKDKGNSMATIHSYFADITTDSKKRANLPIVFEEITAYGRDHMYGLMRLVEDKFGEDTVAYTHTDSLLFNKKGVSDYLESLGLIGNDIGQLKREHRGQYEIYGINDFVIHDIDMKKPHWVHGGISNEAVMQDNTITNVRRKTARSPEFVPKPKSLSELRKNKNNRKLNFVEVDDEVKRGFPHESMWIPERRKLLPHPSGRKNVVKVYPNYLNTMYSELELSMDINKQIKKRAKNRRK